MESRVKIFGHPIHPMLVPFPIAFYTATITAFSIYAVNSSLFWLRVGIINNIAGIGMALIAATVGLLDWTLAIPGGTAPKRTGRNHMILNILALLAFAGNLYLYIGYWNATATTVLPSAWYALALAGFGFVVTLVSGSLGWKLVQTHHVGILPGPTEVRVEERRRRAA